MIGRLNSVLLHGSLHRIWEINQIQYKIVFKELVLLDKLYLGYLVLVMMMNNVVMSLHKADTDCFCWQTGVFTKSANTSCLKARFM